jgi:hypothetical protein
VKIVVSAREEGLGAISCELTCIDIPTPEGEGYQFNPVIIYWSNGSTGTSTAITVMRGETIDITATAMCDVYVDGEYSDTWELDSYNYYEETEPAPPPTPPEEDDPEEPKFPHPGAFLWYNFAKDTIICSPAGLTAAKVDRWCDHCEKYLSWKSQSDMTGAADGCKVNSGDLITADWYNKCADLCGVPHVERNALITADLFRALGAAISKEE